MASPHGVLPRLISVRKCQRIGAHDIFLRGDLDQAQLREKRFFTHEFGINADTFFSRDQRGKALVVCQVNKVEISHREVWSGLRLRILTCDDVDWA